MNSELKSENLKSENIKSNKPLLQQSHHRNNIPAFDLIKTEHFLPALGESIAQTKAEIEKIKAEPNPNFANIIEALEASGRKLDTVASVFFHFDGVCNTPEIQAIALDFKTKLTNHSSDISLDAGLFAQIKKVYDSQPKNLSPEQQLLLNDTYKSFVRNGALLDENNKEIFREIDEKLAELSNNFAENILSETNAFELFINDEAQLAGLPEGAKIAAAEAAKETIKENPEKDTIKEVKYLLTLHGPSVVSVLTYAENRELREKIWRAFSTRCKTGKFNNQNNLLEIVQLRHQRAQILGYKTHADFVLEERMAKNTETVFKMLENYKNIVKNIAKKEHEELQKFAQTQGFLGELKPWDINFYAEKMKAHIYGFDSEELRPYFQFEKARKGAFDVAEKLYNISFKPANDYPKYHQDVETFDVIDNQNNSLVGVLYTDYFPRKTKRGGAWMNDYVPQTRNINGERLPPVIGNHGNFTKPTADKPSLITLDEVLTLFHEFGHGLHGLLSDTKYRSQAGTNVKWDFVELPSQIMENWVKEPEVLNMFAQHFETGATMPKELIEKTRAAENFRAASFFLRQIMMANLDMQWHTTNPEQIQNVEEFERKICEPFYILPPEGALTSPAFSHIFDGGYSAGYYSYKWAEVLDADAFEAFKENGLFNPETAKKFRKLLSSGGSKNPEDLYIEFRGKQPDPEALLRREGLV
jgi:peptidyl-dipeptidase Dcp